jgi:hypothetical protein
MLTAIDWIIMLVYFSFTLRIGVALKRHVRTGTISFWLAGPFPHVCGLAFHLRQPRDPGSDRHAPFGR